jgi:tripartite-type tricarboxylate transporter receptor subunit TctC
MLNIVAAGRMSLVLAACGAAGASAAHATGFPEKPLRMLVGFSAGGGTDVVARILAQKMSETIGQWVVVENRSGASGLIAADAVAKSPADGYTLMMGSQTTLAVAPRLYRKAALETRRDFAGIAMAGISPLILVAHPAFPAHSVSELIAMVKANPGGINFASGGLGTTPHMAGELFCHLAGIRMSHVAYRGEAPAINDVIGGQIQLIFANLSAVIGNVQAGQLRALAVTSRVRAAAAPQVPMIAEAAIAGFEASTWFALVAPAGTPRDVLLRLNNETKHAHSQPHVVQRFAELGMTADDMSAEQVDEFIQSEIVKWERVIKEADIRALE